MTNLKTKESTLKTLEIATRRSLSPNEIREQRLSFIMGNLDKDSPMTKAQVKEILAKQEGEKIKK